MADNSIIRQIRPGESLTASSGKSHKFIVHQPRPLILIDGHSHIQNGACCPLPLIWYQNKITDITRPPRQFMDLIAPLTIGDGGRIQRLTIEGIGAELVGETQRVFTPGSLLRESKMYVKYNEFFMPAIIMTMDLDYAHIAGFPSTGSMIYHEGEIVKWMVYDPALPPVKEVVNGVFYYERADVRAPEEKGKLIDVSSERPNRVWVYQKLKAQIDATINAVKKAPWLLLPMFFYDPRRWRFSSNGDKDDKKWTYGPWDYPFDFIATLRNAGIFIGFKMYTALGHKPLDSRLPHLEDFYARCEADGIPILAHCSPGGMTTHDAELYYQLDGVDLNRPSERTVSCGYDPCSPIGYFNDNYVHPHVWRPVLLKYPKLKLCLAHCGGSEWENVGLASDWIEEIVNMTNPEIVQGMDEQGREIRFKNVYTDMACFNMENPDVRNSVRELLQQMKNRDSRYGHLQDKLMFGVDWYLSLITQAPKYKEYVESFFTAMSEIDEKQWVRSSLVNPAVFYGLDNTEKMKSMYRALSTLVGDKDKKASLLLDANYKNILNIKDQIDQFRFETQKTNK